MSKRDYKNGRCMRERNRIEERVILACEKSERRKELFKNTKQPFRVSKEVKGKFDYLFK